MIRPGLRTRVTTGFAVGALVLSACMAGLSYELTSRTLLASRERTAVRAAYQDAAVVQAGLAAQPSDIVAVLRSIDTGTNRRAVLRRDGEWYARNADLGLTEAVPASLQQLVTSGQPAAQRVDTSTGPAVVVGVPLPDSTGFYVVDSVEELDHTLRVLALVLTLVAAATTAAGAGLGWWMTRRALRPLDAVAAAANEISAGDLAARLDPATEPDLARLATSFNEMVDKLAARIERDRRFAADVSHELRSPLQTLAAAADVLLRYRGKLQGRAATAVGLLSDEVARFQTLVTDLLELARGDQPPQRAPVDVAQLARHACATRGLSPQIVHTNGDGQVWYADRRRLAQVLGNLLDNAGQHGGGATAVRLGRAPGVVFLEVDDEGPGVPAQDREAIFDRFVRGRPATARGDGDGTGLGLALVAQHVTAHGGSVRVTDRPGGGARFRVELPQDAQ